MPEKNISDRRRRETAYVQGFSKKDYIETGLGRRPGTESINRLLSVLDMSGIKSTNKSGVVYIAGNEMAKKVNLGKIPGQLRTKPQDAVHLLLDGLLSEAGATTERDSLTVRCRGFGFKSFGATALKVVAHLYDTLNDEDEPIMMKERLRFMDLLDVKQKPSVKPYELITHHAELGVVEGFTVAEARKIINNVQEEASQLDVGLMPVSSVLSQLPDNWT